MEERKAKINRGEDFSTTFQKASKDMVATNQRAYQGE